MATGSGGGNWPWATILLGPSTSPLPTLPPRNQALKRQSVTTVYHRLLPLTPTCGLGVGSEGQPSWEPGVGSLHAQLSLNGKRKNKAPSLSLKLNYKHLTRPLNQLR